jgi:hypothetical protein
MDRQLAAPLRIIPTSPASPLSSTETYHQLRNFIPALPAGSSRAQLERLVDSLGVDVGLVQPDESERREEARRAERAKRRAERRKAREEAEKAERERDVAGEIEGLIGGDEDMEGGAGGEGEGEGEGEGMADRGDVEYGDMVDEDGDDDEDEPDNEDAQGGMEVDRD